MIQHDIKNFINNLVFLFLLFSCSSEKSSSYKVHEGEFFASITETGELQAVHSKPILMPFIDWKYGWGYKITWLAEHGSKVKKGDVVAKIDQSSVLKFLYEQKDRLELEKANLSKMQVSNESRLAGLKSQYLSEEANYNLIKLQIDKFKFETENKIKIKNKELEKAEINLNRVKKQEELQKTVFENETRIQIIRIKQIEDNIKEAEAAFKKLDIYSPGNGIMQLSVNRRTNQIIKIGDEIYQGMEIAKVPDLNEMKAFAKVNEEDISKVALHQDVFVRLDAYPEKVFKGKLTYIGKLSYQKDWNSSVKVFDIEILLSESDESLKPGMTVSCEIICAKYKDQFYVENECIYKDNGSFYIIPENSKSRIKVRTGASNNKYTVVYGNLEKGIKIKPVNVENSKNEL